MQATTRFHDHVMNVLSPQTKLVLHNATTFDAPNHILNQHTCLVDPAVFFPFFVCQFSSTRFFLWLNNHDPISHKSLKSLVLIQGTSGRQSLRLRISETLILPLPFIGHTQAMNTPCRIDDQQVLHHMLALFATIIEFLFIWIAWSIYRSFGSIVDKKGER
jgi:hypothetical protein